MANHVSNIDLFFMQRAIQLARKGLGAVSPNPLVGAVVVHQDKIIGEGWHRNYGGPHAEVEAIADVEDQGLLQESTLYVNLEPCSHHGKTPPCADLVIAKKIKRVVVANLDQNPLVAGKGLKRLKQAGVEVLENVMASEGKELNQNFFYYLSHQRPRIILKWAETADGYIARADYSSKWISDDYSRMLVHKWRSEEDAIMVGTNTGYYDNPSLTVRSWFGRNPVRLVIDRNLRLPVKMNLFDGSQSTIVFNLLRSDLKDGVEYIQLSASGFWDDMMPVLYQRDIQSVLVEGGAQLLNYLIDRQLWDEARVFKCPVNFGSGIAAPTLKEEKLDTIEELRADRLFIYQRN